MKITKRNKILFFFGLLVIIFILAILLYRPVIFQEGNPWPEIKAISQLTFDGSDMVKLFGSDNKYLTKSQGGPQVVESYMKNQGYEFTDQMGSGYFYKSPNGNIVITRRQYSRFYTLWTINRPDYASESIEWLDYKNNDYGFTFSYPSLSIDNQLWGNLTETLPLSEVLLPNQVLSKGNNFYLHQKYILTRDQKTRLVSKTENTFILEYDGSYNYPLAWHIVILDAGDEGDLDKVNQLPRSKLTGYDVRPSALSYISYGNPRSRAAGN